MSSDDHPGEDELYGANELMSLVERIRYWVRGDGTVAEQVEAVETYINRGVEAFERLLQRHAEFDAWLAERSVS